ncbi:2-hydroxy-acid oxidase [bacterium]|nr:2-hydroxy-acid oxidase [bacterium]
MSKLSDLTSQCIRCGFCLESCPTFLITGDESQSPRGRITLAREADQTETWSKSTHQALDSCLGCRACETACPSGVQYGKILELARAESQTKHGNPHQKTLINTISNHKLARFQFALGGLLPGGKPPAFISKLLSGQPAEANAPTIPEFNPWPPIPAEELPPIIGEVYLLEGCVMRVLYPGVHEATRRLLRRVGFTVRESNAGCCGALHAHAGYLPEAESRAQALASAMPDNLPVIINSAGCGSTIKEYGSIIGQNLEPFAQRAQDATTFLANHGLTSHLQATTKLTNITVTYHEACHLVHGQKISQVPKNLLKSVPGITLVPLSEAELCCGSAGTYNVFQPAKARELLNRKWANITQTQAQIVVTGNPGCQSWIEQANQESNRPIRVLHTLELLESAFSGLRI